MVEMKKVKKQKIIVPEIANSSTENELTVKTLKTENESSEDKTTRKDKKKKKKKVVNGTDEPPSDLPETKMKEEEEISQNTPNHDKSPNVGKQSNMRAVKKRLEVDYNYITDLMSCIHIPNHKREADEDEDVNDVPDHIKKKMKKTQDANRAANSEELRERLHKKLEELKGKKMVGDEAKKQKKIKKQLAKIEKKKALQEEVKMKQKLMKLGNKAGKGNKVKMEAIETAGAKLVKPVKTNSGKVVFSKFDFTEESGVGEKKKKETDPKAALKQIEKKKEKLRHFEEIGKNEKVKMLEDKAAWKTAMERAEGVVVKDDVLLLKKSIKKIEQQKKSGKKKWENRVEQTEKRMEGKQQKRTDNIQKRKKEKKQKKRAPR